MYRLLTSDGSLTTTQLVEMAVSRDEVIKSLSVQTTTLDDVFVHYTGRQLRDEQVKAVGFHDAAATGDAAMTSNDGDCRTRDAEVLPLAGADDGLDDASAGATAHPRQRLWRQDSRGAHGGCRLRRRIAGAEDPRGLRLDRSEHPHLYDGSIQRRAAGARGRAHGKDRWRRDHSGAIFAARARGRFAGDWLGGRQLRPDDEQQPWSPKCSRWSMH